jgi:hypothetical protein
MKQLISYLLLPAALLWASTGTMAQSDIFGGLFEKEEPQFFSSISPTDVPGEAVLVYHFTHSKISELEVSVWAQGLGTSLQDSEAKKMMKGLHTIGNRQRDTVRLSGLKAQHFYNIGVDFRQEMAISRKFASKVVREHYLYPGAEATNPSQPANSGFTAKSPNATRADDITPPCEDPILQLQVDPAGYCGNLNRPAVIVSCQNCQGRPWDFSVEVKLPGRPWEATRADGQPQAALGVSPRTEPLCMLTPGDYQLRVLGWGEHCSMPIIKNLGTTIQISGPERYQNQSANNPALYRQQPAEPVMLPEVCGVSASAVLVGKTIRGGLRLPGGSACTAYNPYVELVYVHPGYRDIDLGNIQLYSGTEMPFELDLDQQDLQRGIHTLKATVYLQHPDLVRPMAAETFWIRAENEQGGMAKREAVIPDLENRLGNEPGMAYEETPSSYDQSPAMQGTISQRGIERGDDLYIDEALLEEEGSTINVRASDPNCNQLQDLQLVYSPTQPDRPLYLSWLSPRCCQETGCEYTVWAGPNPDKLSLLVKGQKPGAQVSELLQGLPASHRYFEVAVQTSNGVRKAAYIPGQGPIYGIEAVLAYHDQFTPQYSDPVVGMTSDVQARNGQVGGDLSDRADLPSRPVAMSNFGPQQPRFPISKFKPCQYERETTLSTDSPLQEGEELTIRYQFSEPGHEYTLYHQPTGSDEWVVAPGTQDLQPEPVFNIQARNYHNGNYLILVYKPSKNWGCLSAPLNDPIEIQVIR